MIKRKTIIEKNRCYKSVNNDEDIKMIKTLKNGQVKSTRIFINESVSVPIIIGWGINEKT